MGQLAGRHNRRQLDDMDRMKAMAIGMDGKRLTYEDLIGPPQTRLTLGSNWATLQHPTRADAL